MMMSQVLQKAFPKFAELIRTDMPVAALNLRVKSGISSASGASVETVGDGLQWNALPRVQPADLVNHQIGMGLYIPGSDTLRVDYRFVLQYEADRGMVKVPNGQALPYVYVLLLHELAHWAAERDGIEEKEEVGDKAETILYGGKIYPNTTLYNLSQKFGSYEAMVKRVRAMN
jgi:hypothetical protein